ncbi:MAG: hypothetical protein Q4B96_06945 [Bacillota bacterium]|nr:hypothetical protein [Bacillota bacterium]
MVNQELEQILQRISDAEQYRDANYAELWEDCYRRYRSRVRERREGSNIFVPQTFMQCEVIKARISESLFASRPYIAVLPREGKDTEQAQKLQTLLDWQLNERMDLTRIIGEQVADSVIIYGTGIVYTTWQVKKRRIKSWSRLGNTPLKRVQESEQVLWDDPVVSPIPLADFFVDREADSIERARYCGHKEYRTRAQLQALCDSGAYNIDWRMLQPYDGGRGDAFAAAGGAADFADGDENALYLVHHYWQDDRHVVIVNRELCACDEENPFWHGQKPYDKCCYVQLPEQFYGMGVPEILAGLQDELNTGRNQRIDYNSLALRRMWKLRKGCGLTARDLVWRQNGVLSVENMDDVQEINIQDIPAAAFVNEGNIKQDMQDVTGCQDIIMGLSYQRETATTTMTRDNNASLRFKVIVTAMVKDMLVPVARKCVSLDQQFMSEKRAMRLLNAPAAELFEISPDEVAGSFDLMYCGTAIDALANKELNKERALQAYSLALRDSAYQQDQPARLRLFRRVLEALEIKDADALLPEAALAEPQLPAADIGGTGAGGAPAAAALAGGLRALLGKRQTAAVKGGGNR